MKKFFSMILILCFTLAVGLTFSFKESESSLHAAESVKEIGSAAELTALASHVNNGQFEAVYNVQTIRLNSNINLTDVDWTPIGTETNPFKWNFDGNGFVIFDLKIKCKPDAGTYQGLFGKTDGAVIENLQINGFECEEWTNPNEACIGLIVGYATNGTKIRNCEIINDTEDTKQFVISRKVTFGGMAGWLENSTVTNCALYYDLSVKFSLINGYTIKIGSVAGIFDASQINNTAAFTSITISGGDDTTAEGLLLVGGLVGEITNEGNIKDCVFSGRISYDNSVSGLQAGKVAGEEKNATGLRSIAYVVFDRENITKAYGGQTIETNNVMAVPENLVKQKSFYENNASSFNASNQTKIFEWTKDGQRWNFNETWIIVGETAESPSQLRLQLFQNFMISLSPTLASPDLMVLEEGGQDLPEDNRYPYNTPVEFKFKFRDATNEKYYHISDIVRGNEPLGYDKFKDVENGKQSREGDVTLTYQNGVYTLTIIASEARAGIYFIRLEATEYEVYIKSGENGFIRFQDESDKFNEKPVQKRSKGQLIKLEAGGNKQYAFSSWSLYYETPDGKGELNYKDKNWTRQPGFETGETGYNKNRPTFEFGQGFFNQNVLLVANFVHAPLRIAFSFDYEMINKIEIVSKDDNNADVVKAITVTGSGVELDKNEFVRLKIYVRKDAEITPDDIAEDIAGWFTFETSKVTQLTPVQDPNDANLMIYEFTFSTSAINYSEQGSDLSLIISSKHIEQPKKDYTMWIIIGAVGGAVLLAVIGIVIWLIVRRKYTGGGKKVDDYKKMYY